ncbi:MAG: hypothetical protein ACE5SW_12920 [Nitrososphaeraceae archaeon]
MKNNLTLTILFLTLSILVGVSTLNSIYSQENATDSKEPIKFFAIQHAQSGSISEINNTFTLSLTNESNKTSLTSDTSKIFSFELNDVSDKTILFAERPDRIVTSISTSDFIGNWSSGDNSFAVDAHNAVLVLDELKGQQETTIIELFDPVYDIDQKTVKYEVIPDNRTPIDLPNEFGQSTLVIDSHCNPLDPRC